MTDAGFTPGELVVTPGAQAIIDSGDASTAELLLRHYEKHPNGQTITGWLVTELPDLRLWVVTEADRSKTTIGLIREINAAVDRSAPTVRPTGGANDA